MIAPQVDIVQVKQMTVIPEHGLFLHISGVILYIVVIGCDAEDRSILNV